MFTVVVVVVVVVVAVAVVVVVAVIITRLIIALNNTNFIGTMMLLMLSIDIVRGINDGCIGDTSEITRVGGRSVNVGEVVVERRCHL